MTHHFSERHFEALLENLGEGVVFIGKGGSILRMNTEALRSHGFKSQEEMLSDAEKYRGLLELRDLNGNLIAFENWPVNRLLRGEKFKALPISIEYPDSPNRNWIGSYSSVSIFDAEGEFSYGALTVRDITKEVRLERALRDSKNYFAEMVDTSPALLWITEVDGTCSYLSQQWYDFTGQTPETGLGFGWLEATHPEDKEESAKTFEKATKERKPFKMHYRLRRKDGEYRWAIDAGNPRFDHRGNFLGFVGTVIDVHEQKLGEQAIKENEERLTLALEASNIGFYEWDIQKNEIFFSPQMMKDWGLPREHVGKLTNATAMIHPDDRAWVEAEIARCVRENFDYSVEYRVIRPTDGKIAWMEVRGKIDYDKNRSPTRFLGTCINISARKEVEQSLKRATESFELVANNIPQLAWMADATGSLHWYNQQWFDYTGTTFEQMQGWGWKTVQHPDHLERVTKVWTKHLEAGEPWEDVFPLKSKAGEWRWFLSQARPIKDESGKIVTWFGTNTDITEQREAQSIIDRANDQFKAITELAPQFVWMSDANGKITYSNPQLLEFMGVSQEETKGDNWLASTIHPDDQERVAKAWANSVESGNLYEIEFRVRAKSGDYCWLLNRAGAVRDKGRITKWIGISVDITEKKKAEAKLLRTTTLLNSIMTSSSDVIYVKDRQSRMVYCNPTALKLIGKSEAEIYGKNDVEFLGPGNGGETILINDERIMSSGRGELIEELVTWGDGSQKIYSSLKEPQRDASGNVTGLIGISRNIDDLKKAQAEVLTERKNIRNLLKQTPELFCITSGPEHLFEFVNEAHVTVLGFDSTGKTVKEAQPESIEVHGLLDEVYLTGETKNLVEVPITVGPKLRHFDLTFSARRDEKDKINGVMILGMEVTFRVESRHALEVEKRKFEAIFQESPALMALLKGSDFVYDKVNPAYKAYVGDRDLIGKPLLEALPELRGQPFYDIMKKVYETGEPFATHSFYGKLIRKPGGEPEDSYFDFSYLRILDADGNPYGVYIHANDTTEQVKARQNIERLASSLQEAVQARDEFLSIASHELKTPLTSLKLQAQLHARAIKKKDPMAYSPERVDDIVHQTDKQVHRLTRLVDDMLDVSRIRSGKLNIEREHFDICELIDEVLGRMKHQFAGANIPAPVVTRCDNTEGDWDRLRIEQVITNLLTNAIRYGRNRPIEIQAESTVEGGVRISVKDSGIGIAKEAREKIFDRFERAIDANEVSGLGLGLFITKQIVKAHGGRIWVESELEKGSTFIFELPRQKKHMEDREVVDVL